MKCLKREEKFIAGIPPNRREQQQQLWQRLPYKHFEITPAQYDETQQIAINKKKVVIPPRVISPRKYSN